MLPVLAGAPDHIWLRGNSLKLYDLVIGAGFDNRKTLLAGEDFSAGFIGPGMSRRGDEQAAK